MGDLVQKKGQFVSVATVADRYAFSIRFSVTPGPAGTSYNIASFIVPKACSLIGVNAYGVVATGAGLIVNRGMTGQIVLTQSNPFGSNVPTFRGIDSRWTLQPFALDDSFELTMFLIPQIPVQQKEYKEKVLRFSEMRVCTLRYDSYEVIGAGELGILVMELIFEND